MIRCGRGFDDKILPVCMKGRSVTGTAHPCVVVCGALDDKVLSFLCVCLRVFDWCGSVHAVIYIVLSFTYAIEARHVAT